MIHVSTTLFHLHYCLLLYSRINVREEMQKKSYPSIIKPRAKHKRVVISQTPSERSSSWKEENVCCSLCDSCLLHLADEPYIIHIIFPFGNTLPAIFSWCQFNKPQVVISDLSPVQSTKCLY